MTQKNIDVIVQGQDAIASLLLTYKISTVWKFIHLFTRFQFYNYLGKKANASGIVF